MSLYVCGASDRAWIDFPTALHRAEQERQKVSLLVIQASIEFPYKNKTLLFLQDALMRLAALLIKSKARKAGDTRADTTWDLPAGSSERRAWRWSEGWSTPAVKTD